MNVLHWSQVLYSLKTTELSFFNWLLKRCNLCKPDRKDRTSGRSSNLLFPKLRDSNLKENKTVLNYFNCYVYIQGILTDFKQAVTCLSEENSGGRSVKKLFFKSTFFKDVNFPINGGTVLSSLLQILKALGFPFVALSKILSAILFLCEYCSQAQALPPGPQSFSHKTPDKNSSSMEVVV